MSDAVQLVPSVAVVARLPQARPDHLIDPAKYTQTGNRRSNNEDDQPAPQSEQQNRHLTITRHDTLHTFVYRSIDEESGDVVWQYPSENMLRMSEHWHEMKERENRHVVDEKV